MQQYMMMVDARFSGIVTATNFVGDISDLTGAAMHGLGTALSQTQTDPLNKIYFTDNILEIFCTTTIESSSINNCCLYKLF